MTALRGFLVLIGDNGGTGSATLKDRTARCAPATSFVETSRRQATQSTVATKRHKIKAAGINQSEMNQFPPSPSFRAFSIASYSTYGG